MSHRTRHLPALRRALAVLVALVAAVAAVVPVAAATRVRTPHSPLLWATVNTCDTSDHPDTVGVRGSMPGSGIAKERMFMRFSLEYLSSPDGTWRPIGKNGDSGWIAVGSGKYRSRQSGRNFTVRPPATGAFRLRGLVRFEWRRGSRVTASARHHTAQGHPGTAGADPAGYSAASCDVKRP